MKVKLEIKDVNGKIVGTIEKIEVFCKEKPLIFNLEISENEKTFTDTRVLKITPKYKLVLT